MYREKNWRETSVAETPLRSPNRVQILGGKACSRATGSEPCVVVALTGQDPECAPKWAARSVGSESEAELLSLENALFHGVLELRATPGNRGQRGRNPSTAKRRGVRDQAGSENLASGQEGTPREHGRSSSCPVGETGKGLIPENNDQRWRGANRDARASDRRKGPGPQGT